MRWNKIAAWLLLASGAGLSAACGEEKPAPRANVIPPEVLAGAPHLGRPDDGFVGSGACKECHQDQHASWHRSYHRTMTQPASDESVKAPFDGVTLKNRGQTYELSRRGDGYFVRTQDPSWGRRGLGAGQPPVVERRVVMTTGSHHMQVYWMETPGPEREHDILPFVYLLPEQRWVPRADAFIAPPGGGRMISLWNDNCIRCHTTGGQPGRSSFSGRFDTRVAELGIACEMCHGPGAEHVEHHGRIRDGGGEQTPAHAIVHPHQLDTVRGAQICGQCHGISGPPTEEADNDWYVNGYPYRAGGDLFATRGITRHPLKASVKVPRVPSKNFPVAAKVLDVFYWADGMVRVSGREYNGLIESACYQRGEMTCFSCHSLHDSEPNDQLAAGMDGDKACTECHEAIAGNVPAHTHHAPASSGSRCMNCHMPHTTYGLYSAIRSHEISSPSVAESVGKVGRPNACNLCHLDRSLEWTGNHMTSWYGHKAVALAEDHRKLAASVVWLARGDAGQRALIAWHMGWETAREAAGADWIAPHLSMTVANDSYAAVRFIAARSLRRFRGLGDWRYDFLEPQAARKTSGLEAYRLWQALDGRPKQTAARLGFTAEGKIDEVLLRRLIDRRDERPVFLAE